MASQTPRFALTTLDSPVDTIGYQGYKFTDIDRRLLDSLLANGVEGHRHTGQAAVVQVPPAAPRLVAVNGSGQIPATTAVHYRYGILDSLGQEQIASQIASVVTPPRLSIPSPPTLESRTGGNLAAGQYSYAISSYGPTGAYETTLSEIIPIAQQGVGSILIQFPTPPTGVVGFNVYRRGPTDSTPFFLCSIPVTRPDPNVPSAAVPFTDNGSLPPDLLRPPPTANTSNCVNGIEITPPTAISNWRVYRTFDLENWGDSLIAWNTGVEVLDTGLDGGGNGSPLTASSAVGGPPQVDLATETTGLLPAANLTAFQHANFTFPGPVVPAISAFQWVNEYATAKVLGLRATLARDTTAASQPAIVAVERYTPSGWQQYLQTASIPVGSSAGTYVAIDQTSGATSLAAGVPIRAVINQGTSGTSQDLTVSVRVAGQV